MTAWTVVVAMLCLITKCGIDFIALEYGGRFQFISDGHLFIICAIACVYALYADAVNFMRKS